MKKLITLSIVAIIVVPIVVILGLCISTANTDTTQKNLFKAKYDERTAFYDKMYKIISQKSQVAVQNDSSFRKNIDIIMTSRESSNGGTLMKWITEVNPNANYAEVAALYKDLSRSIEAEREGFYNREKELQDIKLQNDNLMKQFPANIFFSIMGRTEIAYKPITSDRTDEVISTGKDNNTNVF